jgi:ankyrin repeat protein
MRKGFRRGCLIAICLPLLLAAAVYWIGSREARHVNCNLELLAAARSGDAAAVQRLLGEGADADARSNYTIRKPISWTRGLRIWLRAALHRPASGRYGRSAAGMAIEGGHEDIYRLLIARGVPADEQDDHGETLLWIAASAGRRDIVLDLLRRGADPNSRDHDGLRPLDAANNSGQWDIARLLHDVQLKRAAPQR